MPTARTPDALRHTLHRLHLRLATSASLEPSPDVDLLFSELVQLVRYEPQERVDQILADPAVLAVQPSLHRLCSEGECALERAWTSRVLRSRDPWAQLLRFPYYDNYRQLTHLEYHALRGLGFDDFGRVAFVGSGPLPLTAVFLSRAFGLQVDNVDRDLGAVQASRQLAGALGLQDLSFIHADLFALTDLSRYGLVVLAALVGLDRAEKLRALDHLARHMAPGALLVVRTAHALRALLYPPVDPDDLVGFTPLAVIQPLNDVINSIIVAQRKPGASAGLSPQTPEPA